MFEKEETNEMVLEELSFSVDCFSAMRKTREEMLATAKRITPEGRFRVPPARQDGLRRSFFVVSEMKDPERTIALRQGNFTYSLLKGNYSGWDKFTGDAQRYFHLYQKEFTPEKTQRVGVRSLCRFIHPQNTTTYSPILKELDVHRGDLDAIPFEIIHKDTQFYREMQLSASIVQFVRTLSAIKPAPIECVLDINVFAMSKTTISDAEIPGILERIYELKKRLFLELITHGCRNALI